MDSIEYLPQVSWETNIYDVVLISEATDETPAQWRVTVKPKDLNESGTDLDIEIDFYLIDNAGNQFRVINNGYNGTVYNLLVSDDFRCGWCPQPDMTGLIVKSVGNGVAPHIAPSKLERLDSKAKDNVYNKEKDIQWKYPNDVNVKWHPNEIIFSANSANPNEITYTSGKIFIHEWTTKLKSEYVVNNVSGRDSYHPEKSWDVTGATINLEDNELYYIFAKVPVLEATTTATIVVTKTYRYEKYYDGYLNILMGIYNSVTRDFSMLWGNSRKTEITNNNITEIYPGSDEGSSQFELSYDANIYSIRIYVDGVRQHPDDYTIVGYVNDILVTLLDNPVYTGQVVTIFYELYKTDTTIIGEVPTGDIDGVNLEYTLANIPDPSTVEIYRTGILQKKVFYNVDGTLITFLDTTKPLYPGEFLMVDYKTSLAAAGGKYNVTPTGLVNGSNKVFSISTTATDVMVYLEGVRQKPTTQYVFSVGNTITFVDAPFTGQRVLVDHNNVTTDIYVTRGDYVYHEQSRTADTAGDWREYADDNGFYTQYCTVGNAIKGQGTWLTKFTIQV